MNAPVNASSNAPDNGNGMARWRRIGLLAILLAVVVAGVWYAWWWYETGQRYVSTDNAYVQGHLLQVTGQTAGTVLAIHADETERVGAGQKLIVLDPTDARLAVAQAEAQLAQSVRELQTVYANDGGLRAQIDLKAAELVRARAELTRTEGDLKRRLAMANSGAISVEDLRNAQAAAATARSNVTAADAALNLARESRSASRMLVAGTTVRDHPNVQRAAVQLRTAYVELRRTTILAPTAGHIARRSVQVGQRIAAGAALMTLVALDQVWVEANFKESQMGGLRIGQPVQLTADIYGDSYSYSGRIAGMAAGTGAAFALLPPQNATGNWIKVVQRLPVRITLDPKQLAERPLRVGLSMRVQVDIGARDGKPLSASGPAQAPSGQSAAQAAAQPPPSIAQTAVFDNGETDALVDREIARIIEQNLVAPPVAARRG